MASDPTDLIRAVDAALATSDGATVPVSRYLLRRLRDALATMGACPHDTWSGDGTGCWRCDQCGGWQGMQDVGEVRRQLAEANATIQRVRALAEQYDDQCGSCGSISGGRSIAEDIRRAIEGPS